MKLYTFHQNQGTKITKFDSNFVMSKIVQTNQEAHVGCMYLGEKGIIGYHQAVVPQLLMILKGEGLVKGEEGEYVPIKAGEAVFWDKNEWHETKSENGLVAIVIESPELEPAKFMHLKYQ
ncbi:cupin domain-containing protein [Rossellomorea oryzaecorticis]|uniref:Cupin domain-containing protein n=1 Tax=Rossellomorea oryzaecorticis TaxID=1396505 RepID=A0ABU9K619_9BACI